MDATEKLTAEQVATLEETFTFYLNTGASLPGLWVYEPHDFDNPFEHWSDGYETREEAELAAWEEMTGPQAEPEGEPR